MRQPRNISALILASAFFVAAGALTPDLVPAGGVARVLISYSLFCAMAFLLLLTYFVLVLGGHESRLRKWILRAIVLLGALSIAWIIPVA